MPAVKMPEGTLYQDKYNIYDPDHVNFVERTDFLQRVAGSFVDSRTPEEVFMLLSPLHAKVGTIDVRSLATTYISMQRLNARLPKFTKWMTGMFPGNKELADLLATKGQDSAAREITISTTKLDILRSGYSPNFQSCLGFQSDYPREEYQQIPVRLAEEFPGIAVAYTQDANQQLTARRFLCHAKIKGTNEDVVVIQTDGCPSNGLSKLNIARVLKRNGIRAFVPAYRDRGEEINVVYQGCPTESIHFDVSTWARPAVARPVEV